MGAGEREDPLLGTGTAEERETGRDADRKEEPGGPPFIRGCSDCAQEMF